MSIGLKRGTVVLSDYSVKWPVEYEKEESALLEIAGSCIERRGHIGSTSIPGLKAKPVIDIDIVIEVNSKEDLNRLVCLLPTEAYEYFGERDIKGDYFFAKGSESSRTHYIHASLSGSTRLSDYVKFRGTLRLNENIRTEYSELKEELSMKSQSDRKVYTKLKGEFISKVISS
jgi:GrpB-like predicted nucleotidyltransferase (UPF0157 family)